MRAKALGRVAILALLASCSAPLPRESVRAAPALESADFRETPIGLCEDYPPESTSQEELSRDLSLLRELGVRVLRVSFGWDDLEPEPDRHAWAETDRFVAAADRHGIQLVPYVAYTPSWAAREPGADGFRSPPREPQRFGALMEQLSRRYAGRIHSWELWNEPDNRDYFTGSAADFAELLKEGALGVRRGNPAAKVVLGGIADDLGFLERLLEEHEVAPFVDIVNLHRYPETWTGPSLESLTDFIAQARAIVDAEGESEPLWLAEVGYSSYRRGAFVSRYASAVYDYEHTPEFQAAALGRIVTLALASEQLSLVAWYEIRDLAADSAVIGDVNNRHLGLFAEDGRPKPALDGFRTVRRLYAGPLRVLAARHVVRGVSHEQVSLHAFERGDGSVVLAAWLVTVGPDRAKTPPGAPDLRRATVEVSVPARISRAGTVTAHDQLGRKLPAPQLDARGSEAILRELELVGGRTSFVEIRPR